MKIIATLTDKDFALETTTFCKPKIRIGARGIVMNQQKQMAVLNKMQKNEYKLLGGGVDSSETPKQAFIREVAEEAACQVNNVSYLGIIKEEQSRDNFKQNSYVFYADANNFTNNFQYTIKEQIEGAHLLWMPPQEALKRMEDCLNDLVGSVYDDVYRSRFMVLRDINIIKYFLNQNLKNTCDF